MNEQREKAFYDWWMFKASEDGRMTPSAVWDAACDWMKEEMLRRLERETVNESFGRDE